MTAESPERKDQSAGLQPQSKWVQTPVTLLHSLLDPYPPLSPPPFPTMSLIALLPFIYKDGFAIK